MTLPLDDGSCGWCDRALFGSRNRKQRKDCGRPDKMTTDQVEQAWSWYGEGLSLRACAARLLPETGYANARSLANILHEQWKIRGYQLRNRIEATVKASTIHGKHGSPEHKRELRLARGEIRGVVCRGTKVNGEPCTRAALIGREWCIAHDPDRRQSLLEGLANGRRRRREGTNRGNAGGAGVIGDGGAGGGFDGSASADQLRDGDDPEGVQGYGRRLASGACCAV